ncbi:MAG: rhodanese-like domain-containing protein [bacterium]|nr:rhodanese-like domain-containing protein [bacterium]
MGFLSSLFGKKVDYAQLLKDGAIVVDVRSKGEFQSGHVKGSMNIPLDQIKSNAQNLKKKNKVLILCCASGMRSGSATSILKKEGIECYNGGGWKKVNQYI